MKEFEEKELGFLENRKNFNKINQGIENLIELDETTMINDTISQEDLEIVKRFVIVKIIEL